MDAEALDLPDDTFDVALCSLDLMYVPNPDRALQEMHRNGNGGYAIPGEFVLARGVRSKS